MSLHQGQPVRQFGASLKDAEGAVVMLHGRGGSAEDILSLASAMYRPGLAYLAPQAVGNSWYPYSFLAPNAGAATAVVVLRHGAFPIALGNEMWQKYKIGEAFKILDPETKAPAVKNPFLHPKPGVLLVDDMAVDRLLANGTVIGACNMALQVQSKMLAGNAGVSAEEAAKEWAANIVPGITIIPSGTWGVNRAQEAGCTYCAGG